jgi:hypothetical protein
MPDIPPAATDTTLADLAAALSISNTALLQQLTKYDGLLAAYHRQCTRVDELVNAHMLRDKDLTELQMENGALWEVLRRVEAGMERKRGRGSGEVWKGEVEDVDGDGDGDGCGESDGEGWKMITGGGEPGDVEVTELS